MKLKTKFQDEDFDLGEVAEANVYYGGNGRIKVIAEPTKGGMITFYFETLKGMNEMFEDAQEEPKGYWFINSCGAVEVRTEEEQPAVADMHKQFGNYFETKEEAEKAVEKLKAITRLNKCGFRFEGYTDRDRASGGDIVIYAHVDIPNNNLLEEAQPDMLKDLDLLFSGKDD